LTCRDAVRAAVALCILAGLHSPASAVSGRTLAPQALALAPLAGPVRAGIVKHYSIGLMERVAVKRGLCRWARGECLPPRGYAGFVSVPYCSLIGRTVWISVAGRAPRPHLVADCSRPGADQRRHLRQGLVAELGYSEALALGFAWDATAHPQGDGRAPARVWGW
jgi:hypothetical protein